jgi:hypothetical protein
MKTIMRGLTLAAVLLTGAVTQAEIVIDSFAGGAAATVLGGVGSDVDRAIANGVTRTTTVGGSNGSIDIGATPGASSAFLNGDGSYVELAYNLTGASIGRNFFVDQVLRTGFVVTSGSNNFTTSLSATSGGATTANASWAGVIPSQFNMLERVSNSGNGHLAAFANVDILTIRFTKIGGGNVFFDSTTGIRAIPEPATMSLLGLTAIGGIFAHRRRKNQLAA